MAGKRKLPGLDGRKEYGKGEVEIMEIVNMSVREILQQATERGASDLFIVAGLPLTIKVNGDMERLNEERVMPDGCEHLVRGIYELANKKSIENFIETGDDDFSFAIPGLSRFRVSTYFQRGSMAAVIRIITFRLPEPSELGIPEQIIRLAENRKGMILVTGPAGSGKSTTLACMIDYINRTRAEHIITLEDPLEYLHRHNKSIVSQREISSDTESYVSALRASLRQAPDVILLGEMRDFDTINIAMTAAETGHLILSSLHTTGAASTIDRIIDVFPANQQKQITIQLSTILQAVVCQQLVPTVDGGRIPAFEIMTMTPALRNMVREHKIHQIDGLVYSSNGEEMISMDNSLFKLYREKKIDRRTAIQYATNPEMMRKKL